jgi:hypothetical protein
VTTNTQDQDPLLRDEQGRFAPVSPASKLPPSSAVRSDGDILTLWPKDLDSLAHWNAFSLIDPERVSSATGILNALRATEARLAADTELSDHGKQVRLESAASSAFHNLGRLAKDVRALEAKYEADTAASISIPKADVNDTLFDIELARQARSEGKIPTLLEMSSERMRLALVRAPVELSGIAPEIRERLRGSFVDHDTALQLEERSKAIAAARVGVQRAIELTARNSDMTVKQMQAIVGDGWNVMSIRMPGEGRLSSPLSSARVVRKEA